MNNTVFIKEARQLAYGYGDLENKDKKINDPLYVPHPLKVVARKLDEACDRLENKTDDS